MKNVRLLAGILALIALVLVACEPDPPAIAFADLPEGDAGSGAKLFEQSVNDLPSCVSCHSLDSVNQAAPSIVGYGAIAGERVSGETAREYSYWSIVAPSRHIVNGFSNVMPSNYDEVLTEQDIADLIAYMLTL